VIRKTFATALVVAIPRAALACPVCFGQTDSPLASATNMGIIVMLGVIGGVLSGFAAFIVHLNRRARLAAGTPADQVRTASGPQLSSPAPQEGIAQC
jgi:hypothetical protein